MSYAAHRKDFATFTRAAGADTTVAPKKAGFLRRIFDAVFEARHRQADRELAFYLEQSGGRLTDDIERKIMRDISSSGWRPYSSDPNSYR